VGTAVVVGTVVVSATVVVGTAVVVSGTVVVTVDVFDILYDVAPVNIPVTSVVGSIFQELID
jgi:hypothetical protein